MHQSVAFEEAFVMLVVLEILLEVTFVIVQFEGLPDILRVVVEGNGALLGLLWLSSVISSLQVVFVQEFLYFLAFLESR